MLCLEGRVNGLISNRPKFRQPTFKCNLLRPQILPIEPKSKASLGEAGANIAVESWVSEFRPCPRFSHLPQFLQCPKITILLGCQSGKCGGR